MRKLIILLMLGFIGCNVKYTADRTEQDLQIIDRTIVSFQTTNILGEEFRCFGTNEYRIIVVNSKGDTVLNHGDLYFEFEFHDFNGDSLSDIVVHPLTNVPGIQNLLLFDKVKMSFTQVSDFESFPNPKPILGTRYFYSYHRSGCADNYWESDLFYIEEFKTHLLANISGNECEGEKGIIVSKSFAGERKIIDKFPIEILEEYDDQKWGFIADYWKKNYSKFIK